MWNPRILDGYTGNLNEIQVQPPTSRAGGRVVVRIHGTGLRGWVQWEKKSLPSGHD